MREHRIIYPLCLIYKGSGWYLRGYCTSRKALRIFRISRIKSLHLSEHRFNRKEYEDILAKEEIDNKFCLESTPICLRFREEALYRLYDEYDDDMIQKNSDGTYSVALYYGEDEWLYGYILSFGNYVRVESPERVREVIKKKIEDMYRECF